MAGNLGQAFASVKGLYRITDATQVLLVPSAWHQVERYANNPIEADHGPAETPAATDGRASHRPHSADHRRGARVVQNIRRGYYGELGVNAGPRLQVAAAFTELALAI